MLTLRHVLPDEQWPMQQQQPVSHESYLFSERTGLLAVHDWEHM